MPVFQSGPGRSPGWCEMEYFEIIKLQPGDRCRIQRTAEKEKLIVTEGMCRFVTGGRSWNAEERAQFDIGSETDGWEAEEVISPTTIVRMCGRWGTELGGSGIFRVVKSEAPRDGGDQASYPKETSFDSHYHDCDEYWILLEGHGVAVSEGRHYEVRAGDCIATGRGHHHDFPLVYAPVKAVYFETTMEGLKRRGHLWEHKDGAAEPAKGRGGEDGMHIGGRSE